MGKVGPCCHCGVTSTPLWRNGPPDKPVLCNACGSRWRTKGTLVNYTPLHARETFDADELRNSTIKSLPFKDREHMLLVKTKQGSNPLELEHEMQYCDQNFRKFVKGNMNNRTSSGSGISNSESCALVGTINANDMAGSSQSNVWESLVPSKKRTFLTRPKASPVDKLTRDLFSILHEQHSSNLSGLSEEELIYENETPFGSEIGYGGLLIRHANSVSLEEESEASSLPLDKSYITNGSYLGPTCFPVNVEIKGSNSYTDRLKNLNTRSAKENARRDKTSHEKLKLLDKDSSLGSTDLNDLINFDGFMKYLTYEEQKQLMKYLPSVDTARLPQSLRNMFKSSQFIETFSFFQQLLQEGIFDLSFSGVNVEDCTTLRRLALLDLEKYKWVENYKKLKARIGKDKEMEPTVPRTYNLTSAKRAHDYWDQDSSETDDGPMRNPKRVCKLGVSNSLSGTSPQLKSSDTASKLSEVQGGIFTRMRILPSVSDMCSVLAPSQFTDDSSDQDLLLNVPCNASYPEAELLCHPWKENSTPISSPAEGIAAAKMEESFSSFRPLILVHSMEFLGSSSGWMLAFAI